MFPRCSTFQGLYMGQGYSLIIKHRPKCMMKLEVISVGLIRPMLITFGASALTTVSRGRLRVFDQGRVFVVLHLLW
jgi:hypothetical protein